MSEFFRAVLIIAGNTMRELVHNKLLYNLLFFAVLLIGCSMYVAQLTIGQWDRIILDMGLAAIELSGTLVAILIGVSLVAGEVERKSVFPTLAKPVPRAGFLIGRFTGLLVMLAINVFIMMAALAAVLRAADYSVSPTVLQAGFLIFLELCLIAAAAIFFGSFTTPVLASAFSLALFLIGHLLGDLKLFGQRSQAGLARTLTGIFYRVLPDLELFNLKSQAANELAAPPGFTRVATLYGVAYTAALLLLAVGVFSKRDLK
jgi:ABC-type transport system involved in multi-copper enzyme maturation permease subunit